MRFTTSPFAPRWFLLSLFAVSAMVPAPALAADQKPEKKAAKTAAKKSDPNRWDPQIQAFEQKDRQQPPPKQGILFVGSSSIRGWDLKRSFPDLPVINRGFGGSQVADSVRYADRIILPHQPRVVVCYAGDNDLAAGKTPQQVADDYKALFQRIHAALPETRIVCIGVKPCQARWKLVDKVRQTNQLIRQLVEKDNRLVFIDVEPVLLGKDGKPRTELFKADGLHLNADGYQLWANLVRPHLTPER